MIYFPKNRSPRCNLWGAAHGAFSTAVEDSSTGAQREVVELWPRGLRLGEVVVKF